MSQWKLFKLVLNPPRNSVGIMCIENSLLLLGGRHGNDLIDKISFMNTITLEIKEVNKLKNSGYFTANHVFIDQSQDLILGKSNEKSTSFEIDLKMIFQ